MINRTFALALALVGAGLAAQGQGASSATTRRTTSGEHQAAYFRRRKRRGVFFRRRETAFFQPTRRPRVRPDLHDEHRRVERGVGKGGRTTCASFSNDKRPLYGSTHLGQQDCPPNPDFSKGYVWAIYPTYDIFSVKADGSGSAAIDQHARLRRGGDPFPNGRKVIFTSCGRRSRSLRDGHER